jgi:hypothetical protein
MPTVSESPALVLLPARALSPQLPSKKDIRLEAHGYVARLALTSEDRAAAFRLRFVVFNLELQEGLESAYITGFDTNRRVSSDRRDCRNLPNPDGISCGSQLRLLQ